MQLCMAIDELMTNIAQYAYAPGTGPVTVRFGYEQASKTVILTFLDKGMPYNPLEKEFDINGGRSLADYEAEFIEN